MAESQQTFDDITERLDEIISQVRSKDTSLERSLDLFDEAIQLGSKAVDMVDSFELSDREANLLLEQERAANTDAPEEPAGGADSDTAALDAGSDAAPDDGSDAPAPDASDTAAADAPELDVSQAGEAPAPVGA